MEENKNCDFHIRNASFSDLHQLMILEQQWPEAERATAEQLKFRLEKFPAGYFIAESQNEIVASLIACPSNYYPDHDQLNLFTTWEACVNRGYSEENLSSPTNALYLVSGTVKSSFPNPALFSEGLNSVINLAQNMKKSYIIAGALIPGYARFVKKYPNTSATEYVFKKLRGHLVDPLMEKYRRVGFYVPDERHVLKDYFKDPHSLNYSALVVKKIDNNCMHSTRERIQDS